MRFSLIAIAGLCLGTFSACSSTKTITDKNDSCWELVWSDDFNEAELDSTVWCKTDRGTPDWANTQSHDPRCFEMRNGNLILKGIVNTDLEADTAHYLTGGVCTKGKKCFEPGRIDVRAKLQGAQGAWPAIWMLPCDNSSWPNGGEIDIMERLSHEDKVYQTVHSHYTYDLRRANDPVSSITHKIDPNDFNVYSAEVYPDSVVFYVNGEHTNTYPRINNGADGQFPFFRPMYLLIDMQLGGRWVGPVDPAQLPVEMEVDWVKYYRRK